jgi:hypothetical protein
VWREEHRSDDKRQECRALYDRGDFLKAAFALNPPIGETLARRSSRK